MMKKLLSWVLQPPHTLPKLLTPILIIPKQIKTRATRRQQHRIPFPVFRMSSNEKDIFLSISLLQIIFRKNGCPTHKKRNFAICLYAESPIKQAQ